MCHEGEDRRHPGKYCSVREMGVADRGKSWSLQRDIKRVTKARYRANAKGSMMVSDIHFETIAFLFRRLRCHSSEIGCWEEVGGEKCSDSRGQGDDAFPTTHSLQPAYCLTSMNLF